MNEKTIIIFSGYNQRAVIAFLRTVCVHNLPYAIIASNAEDPIFKSTYAHAVVAVRTRKELDLADLSACLERARAAVPAERYWVAPSTEALNRFLLDNRQYFESLSVEIPLVGKSLYELISDKALFSRLCRERNICVPAEFPSLSAATVPFVAKPVRYFNATGRAYSPELILTEAEKERFAGEYPAHDFYFQEFVAGQSFYLLYYFAKSGEVVSFSQKNLAQQPGGKSIIAAEPAAIHLSAASRPYEEMFRDLGFTGLVMVEVIEDKDGNFVMIEANPRFWGPSQLFVDNGINLFDYLLFDHGFLPMKPHVSTLAQKKYFWYGGIAQTRNAGQNPVYHCPICPDEMTQYDIYRRKDTLAIYEQEIMNTTTHLIELYQKTSKHSNYQALPTCLKPIIDAAALATHSRHEPERLAYILNSLAIKGKSVMDIGGNTGYFTFEAADAGARKVTYIEGNTAHADFVRTAARHLRKDDVIDVRNAYFDFCDYSAADACDIVLLLNVLHHLGDDFGSLDDPSRIKEQILRRLNSVSQIATYCVFQMGFNWKGDRNSCLFERGTKQEMIDYIAAGVEPCWEVLRTGIAERVPGGIVYNDLNDSNIARDDSLGEFLNRPLFILKSRV